MNIYELPKEIDQALTNYYNCFDEETGELNVPEEELEVSNKALFELQNRKEELLQWYLKDRANKIAENSGLQSEIDRLSARIKQNKKKIERVEKIVDFNCKDTYNGKATNYGSFSVNYKKSTCTIIEDASKIPEKYKTQETVTTTKIPKADIKKAIDKGEKVPGARLEEKLSLKIK